MSLPVHLRLPPRLVEALDEWAKQEDCSRSKLVRDLCREAVKKRRDAQRAKRFRQRRKQASA